MNHLPIRVTPKASRNAIEITEAGDVRIYVTSPPEDGAANAAVLELLAKKLRTAKTSLTIVRGSTSRDKVVDLGAIAVSDALEKLR